MLLDVATHISTNPTAASLRLISRNGWGLTRPNLNLDGTKPRGTCRLRWFEVKLQCFFQVGESLLFGFTLAGDIEFETLRNV